VWSLAVSTGKALADGAHAITVKQTDAAGNVNTSAATSIHVDTALPTLAAPLLAAASDSGSSNKDLLTNVKTPTFSGTGAEANAHIDLMEGTTVLASGTADGSGVWSLAVSTGKALSDGAHTITVKQTDAAGNVNTSAATSIHIDTALPTLAAPLLAAASDSGSSNSDLLTNVKKPTFTGTGAEANAAIELREGSTVLATGTADASGVWSLAVDTAHQLGDGLHAITVHQTDAAGNQNTSAATSITIDTSVPTLGMFWLESGSNSGDTTDNITSIKTPVLYGIDAEAGNKVELFDGTTLLGSATADKDGVWHITSNVLLDGLHNLTVKQTDAAGNISQASTAFPLWIDTTPPAALEAALDPLSDLGASNSDHLTNDTTPTLMGSGADQFAYIELYEGAKLVGSATADDKGNWKVTPTAPLVGEGEHRLSVLQYDAAQNKGTLSEALVMNIDTTAPTVTSNWSLGSEGINFELVFSERVVPISTRPIASLLGLNASLPIDITNGTWTDTTINGHDVTVYHALLSGAGSVDISLSLLQDLAGNTFADPVGHFIVPLTSFYLPPPLY
jgi:hypothetical protein